MHILANGKRRFCSFVQFYVIHLKKSRGKIDHGTTLTVFPYISNWERPSKKWRLPNCLWVPWPSSTPSLLAYWYMVLYLCLSLSTILCISIVGQLTVLSKVLVTYRISLLTSYFLSLYGYDGASLNILLKKRLSRKNTQCIVAWELEISF